MKKLLIVVILLMGFLAVWFLFSQKPKSGIVDKTPHIMKITTTAFNNQQKIPAVYSCREKGINPPLAFSDIPKNAKSLTLIMDDPDAPMGTFVHWVVFNMPISTTGIAENSKPAGIEGKSGMGGNGYIGPCPPSG